VVFITIPFREAKMKEYEVLRPHFGDKDYKEGDIRTADPNVVRLLVENKVLREYETKVETQKPTGRRNNPK
ncbi:hypothetical protein, partial [Acinetobacter baumannii]|uniref:hypothetical protein n=1 Tax=Acinetobacter baumannii TaxID=470 RepID=UPI001A7E6D61